MSGVDQRSGLARRKRICFVATLPVSINSFLRPHLACLRRVCDVTLVANGTAAQLEIPLGPDLAFVPVPIERRVDVGRDCKALWKLWRFFVRERFDCVHSIMPKAGLLTMTAARLARTPVRVHTFSGQVWATRTGAVRAGLCFLDRVLAGNATRLLADSPSQREFLIQNRVTAPAKIGVIGCGSFAGVNVRRFRPDAGARKEVREQFGIPAGAVLFLFFGRLTREKGFPDLLKAYAIAAIENPTIHLLIVGSDEERLASLIASTVGTAINRVHRAGFVEFPEHYLAAADVLCLPSYREGFGVAVIEAAATGIPAIVSRIYGLSDAVEEAVTGMLHPPGDERAMAAAMLELTLNSSRRMAMGLAARKRVEEKFAEEKLVEAFAEFYSGILGFAVPTEIRTALPARTACGEVLA